MKKIVFDRVINENRVEKLKTKFLSEKYIKTMITDDCDGYDRAGNLLFRFRKNIIPYDVLKSGVDAFRDSIILNAGRGISAGGYHKQLRKDGTVGKFDVSPKVESGNVGFMDARRGSGTIAVCRKTAFARDHFQKYTNGVPFVQYIDKLYREICPEQYARQRAIADGTNKNYVIDDTAFTTVTVNRNFQTAVHKDSGDFNDGFGNLIVHRSGHYDGGFFMIPEFGIGFDLQNTDVLFVDVHKWHCNTKFKNTSDDFERISFVLYYREMMYKCLSPSNELKRIKMEQNGYLKL